MQGQSNYDMIPELHSLDCYEVKPFVISDALGKLANSKVKPKIIHDILLLVALTRDPRADPWVAHMTRDKKKLNTTYNCVRERNLLVPPLHTNPLSWDLSVAIGRATTFVAAEVSKGVRKALIALT